jgi:hypothetical protein
LASGINLIVIVSGREPTNPPHSLIVGAAAGRDFDCIGTESRIELRLIRIRFSYFLENSVANDELPLGPAGI